MLILLPSYLFWNIMLIDFLIVYIFSFLNFQFFCEVNLFSHLQINYFGCRMRKPKMLQLLTAQKRILFHSGKISNFLARNEYDIAIFLILCWLPQYLIGLINRQGLKKSTLFFLVNEWLILFENYIVFNQLLPGEPFTWQSNLHWTLRRRFTSSWNWHWNQVGYKKIIFCC